MGFCGVIGAGETHSGSGIRVVSAAAGTKVVIRDCSFELPDYFEFEVHGN